MKGTIGLIANPASGKDIRRIVAYGTTADNVEKINIVRRMILGACSQGVTDIWYMPDYFEIAPQAINGIYQEHQHLIKNLTMHQIDMYQLGEEIDSTIAASKMKECGVEVVIVLGGDGTSRAVAKEIGDIPMISISTGTNNAFPLNIEGTIAGMAAGAYATGKIPKEIALRPSKRVEILKNGEYVDLALIDAVVLDGETVGSRAMWKTDKMKQIFLSRCAADTIGISSIGGRLADVEEEDPFGYYIKVDPDAKPVLAPIAPGLMAEVGIGEHKKMEIGEVFPVDSEYGVIAVDGERNVEFFPGEKVEMRITWDGPKMLNVAATLRKARELQGE